MQDSGKLMFGLFPTFQVLEERGNMYGKKFNEREEEFKSLLSSRNNSILAHGTSSAKKETFSDFNTLLRSVFNINETIQFPKFEW